MPVQLNDSNNDKEQLAALYQISRILGVIDDPKEALKVILKEIITCFGCHSGSIALMNPDTGMLEMEVNQGLPEEFHDLELPLTHGITGWVALHGKPLLVPEVSKETRYFSLKQNIISELAVPMKTDGEVIGVINLDSTLLNGFSNDDLSFLIQLAQESTRVIAQIWQNNHLKLKASHFESLVKAGNGLGSQRDLQEILKSIAHEAHRIMDCKLCAIYLLTPDHERLKLMVMAGADQENEYNEVIDLNESSIGVAIARSKQVEVLNLPRTEEDHLSLSANEQGLVSLLASPIIYNNQVIGVINVYTDHQHRFNDDEKKILATLASLGAVAIENARLYHRVFETEDSLRVNERLTTLGFLAAEIAHEIRNPLTVIKLLFESLGFDFKKDDPRIKDSDIILEKLVHLEEIVERVLSFGKTNETLHSRCFIHSLIEDTLHLVRLKLEQGNIKLNFNSEAESVWVHGNKGQLQQVILNLIINATQAMTQGGEISINIQEQSKDGATQIVIDVSDTGTGMPKEIQSKIFDSFLSNRREGSGLGLSIVKRILKSHKGDIELIRSSKSGTHFRYWLPIE